MYEVVRVSSFSRSRLVYFPGTNLREEPPTFPVEHTLDRNQATLEIITYISPDRMPQPFFCVQSTPYKTEYNVFEWQGVRDFIV